MNQRLKTHPILTLETPLTETQKRTNMEWNEFAQTVSGTTFPIPSTLPYDARQNDFDDIHDQFSPEADEGACPICGTEPRRFRIFTFWFLAIAMLITGAAFGFVGGCEWYAHMTRTITQN